MASLTHVCMWSDNGWKRITAEQAARLHPGGTVSAHSGLFMCELCGQYVILTDGDIRIRYFKHSAYEISKDCPERTFGAGYSISYGSQEHDLPIRITSVSSSSFSFEVGLIRAPISSLGKDFCIEIKPKGAFDIPYVYTKERLNYDSITYLPIGERPFENTLSVSKMETTNYVNSGRQRLKALIRKAHCLKKFPAKNSHMMPMLRLVKNTTC